MSKQKSSIQAELVNSFDGVTDLARHLIKTDRVPGSGDSARKNGASQDWDLGLGWFNALALASEGGYWSEGAKLLQTARVSIDRLRVPAPALERVRSVTGYMPDVPSYLAGLPQAMWADADPEDAPRARSKVLRVGVAATFSGMATSAQVMNRGAAVMSCVDALESEGFRVEVSAVIIAADRGENAFRWDVVIKRSDQDWTPGLCAFALAHPAFNRRLAFGLKERCARAYANTTSTGRYNTDAANFVDGSAYDLWLPRMCLHNMERFTDAKSSAATVVDMLNGLEVQARAAA